MTVIYLITIILLILCFVIIENSLAKEAKARIEKLEKEINLRDQSIITKNDKVKNLEFSIKILNKVVTNLEGKLHRERNEKGLFVKKEKKNEEAA